MSALPMGVPGRRLAAPQTILVVAALLLAIAGILAAANPAVHGLDRDSGFYTYIGDQILHGKLPYRDAWESKPPAIFYLNALALWLGHGSRWGTWALELVSLVAAGTLSFRLIKGLWGNLPALLGMAILLYGFAHTFENGNFTEEYPLPLHFLSILLLPRLVRQHRRVDDLLLGVLLAVCLLFRPNNVIPEVAVILAMTITRLLDRSYRTLLAQLMWIGLGAALPLALTGLYFWSQGLLRDLLNASLFYNLTYSGTGITASSPLDVGLRAFGLPLLILAVIGYVVAVSRLKGAAEERSISIFLLVGSPLAILFSDPARRNYLHYYMNWLPFLTLLGALALHFVLSRWLASVASSRVAYWASGLAALGAAIVFLSWSGGAANLWKAADMFLHRRETGVEYTPTVAVYVEKHTKPGDTVLFWGADPGFNFLSNREAPGAVLYYPLFVPSPISTALDARFLVDLQSRRPVLVVDMGNALALSLDPAERQQQLQHGLGWQYLPANINQVWAFLAQNYSPLAKVSGHIVYGLKEASY